MGNHIETLSCEDFDKLVAENAKTK
jgi:hypothetical protein